MRTITLTVALVFIAVAARAQSPYVAATIGGDISRLSHTDSNVSRGPSGDSEVVSWSLRVGTLVGQNWGTELEFVHSGQSHNSSSSGIPIPLAGVVGSIAPNLAGTTATTAALPIAAFQTDVERAHSDLDAVAWARQRVGGNIDLVYLGGVAFSRERTEISQTFPTATRALVPISGGAFRTTIIDYSVRPLVGVEARIGLTSHVRLIPGLRLQGLGNGWLLRPYAGLGWFF